MDSSYSYLISFGVYLVTTYYFHIAAYNPPTAKKKDIASAGKTGDKAGIIYLIRVLVELQK